MPKPKLSAEQKRAKTVKDAKIIQWIYLGLFAFGLFLVADGLVWWFRKPGIPTALEVVSACGLLLASAFGRADAKETIRRGGEEVKSLGAQLSILLTGTCHALKETALPVSFWPWLLAIYVGLTLAVFFWLTLRLRSFRRKKAI